MPSNGLINVIVDENAKKLRDLHCCACAEWSDVVVPSVFQVQQGTTLIEFGRFFLCHNCFEWLTTIEFSMPFASTPEYIEGREFRDTWATLQSMQTSFERAHEFMYLLMRFYNDVDSRFTTERTDEELEFRIQMANDMWHHMPLETIRQHNHRAYADLLEFHQLFPGYFTERSILKSIYNQAFGNRIRILTPRQVDAYKLTLAHVFNPENYPTIMQKLELIISGVLVLNRWETAFVERAVNHMRERGYWTRPQKGIIGAILIGTDLMSLPDVSNAFHDHNVDEEIQIFRINRERRTMQENRQEMNARAARFMLYGNINASSAHLTLYREPNNSSGDDSAIMELQRELCSLASDYKHRMQEKMRELGISRLEDSSMI